MLAPTYWLNNTVVRKKVLPTWTAIQFPNEEGKGMDSTTQEEGLSGPLWAHVANLNPTVPEMSKEGVRKVEPDMLKYFENGDYEEVPGGMLKCVDFISIFSVALPLYVLLSVCHMLFVHPPPPYMYDNINK